MSKIFGLFSVIAFAIAVALHGDQECLTASIIFALWAILFDQWERS